MRKESQKDKILKLLLKGKKITSIDALNLFGCFRLASVIHKLRKEGYIIKAILVMTGNGTNFAEYSMKIEHL